MKQKPKLNRSALKPKRLKESLEKRLNEQKKNASRLRKPNVLQKRLLNRPRESD